MSIEKAYFGHLGHSPEMSASLQESLVAYVTYCNVGYQTFFNKK